MTLIRMFRMLAAKSLNPEEPIRGRRILSILSARLSNAPKNPSSPLSMLTGSFNTANKSAPALKSIPSSENLARTDVPYINLAIKVSVAGEICTTEDVPEVTSKPPLESSEKLMAESVDDLLTSTSMSPSRMKSNPGIPTNAAVPAASNP